MSDLSLLHTKLQSRFRSLGVKLFVVCGLALLMLIPAFMVGGLVDERTTREAQVVQESSQHVGGQQIFLGPSLLGVYRAIGIEAGIQFPLYRNIVPLFPKERYRFTVNFAYFF